MSLFTKTRYTMEQKRHAMEDIYEIKDLQKKLICIVRRAGKQAKAEKLAGEAEGLEDVPSAGFGEKMAKNIAASSLTFETPDGNKFLTLSKGKGYRNVGFEIRDLKGKVLGSVQMEKRHGGKPRYVLEDSDGNEFAEVKSGLALRHDFKIITADGKEIGKVHKKWPKFKKDAYAVEISDQTFDPSLVLSLAVAIDVIEN